MIAIHNPSNATRCEGGFFTPYWDYYTKANFTNNHNSAVIAASVGGSVGAVAAAGLVGGLLGGLLTTVTITTTTTLTMPTLGAPPPSLAEILAPWLWGALALCAAGMVAGFLLMPRKEETPSDTEEEEPPPPEPESLRLIFEDQDGCITVEEFDAKSPLEAQLLEHGYDGTFLLPPEHGGSFLLPPGSPVDSTPIGSALVVPGVATQMTSVGPRSCPDMVAFPGQPHVAQRMVTPIVRPPQNAPQMVTTARFSEARQLGCVARVEHAPVASQVVPVEGETMYIYEESG
jgi:hypothetical protein